MNNLLISINSDLSVCYIYLLNHFGRYTTHNSIWLNVLRHYSTCCHYCSIANSHACKNGGIGSNPDVFTNVDGSIAHALTLSWIKVVVERCQHDVVAYECTLVNDDTSLILKLAAHIDENSFTNDGVLAAIGMKRRKNAYRLGNFPTPELLQQIVQFFGSMIRSVDLSRYLQCFLR